MAGQTRGRARKSNASKKGYKRIRSDKMAPVEIKDRQMPERPETLSHLANQWWDAVVPRMFALGFVDQLDAKALELAATAWANFQRTDHTEYFKRYWTIVAKFPLTPSDRQKIRDVDPQEKETNEFLSFINLKKPAG